MSDQILPPGSYVIERYVYTRPNGNGEGVQWCVHRVEKDGSVSQLFTTDTRREAAEVIAAASLHLKENE
jgi:hypothetical protein